MLSGELLLIISGLHQFDKLILRRIIMNNIKIFVLVFLFGLFVFTSAKANSPDNTLLRYYSAFLTINLNHSLESSKVLYHLSQEPKFDKDFLEEELNRIHKDIDNANDNIADMIINTMKDKKKAINNLLNDIDKQLAQVSIDLKTIDNKLNRQEDISSLISDIYKHVNKAENEDHKEIIRILGLKKFNEPVLVIPGV